MKTPTDFVVLQVDAPLSCSGALSPNEEETTLVAPNTHIYDNFRRRWPRRQTWIGLGMLAFVACALVALSAWQGQEPILAPGHMARRSSTTCPGGFEQVDGDVSGDGMINGKGGGIQVSGVGICAWLCNNEPLCLSFEYKVEEGRCNLNTEWEPTDDQWYDEQGRAQLFCQKIVQCPGGYELEQGDIPGDGEINGKGGGQEVESVDSCAELCQSESSCLSFEYKVQERRCNLNTEGRPNRPQWKKQLFCRKAEELCTWQSPVADHRSSYPLFYQDCECKDGIVTAFHSYSDSSERKYGTCIRDYWP